MTASAKTDVAQASALYLFAYYIGSSIGGTAGGLFWTSWGWSGIVLFISLILCSNYIAIFMMKRQKAKALD